MNLIRNLLGILITLTLLPICLQTYIYVSKIEFDYNQVNDEIALNQLREMMLIAYDVNVNTNQIVFIYKNKEFKLSLVNRKLLLQPGSQMYLNDVDDLHFINKNNCIYVCYEKNNKEYERIIAGEEGIYIDNFSDCDVLFDGDSDSQE